MAAVFFFLLFVKALSMAFGLGVRTCVRFCCVFFNVLSGFVNGYDICITTGILDDMDRDLKLCHDDGQISTCFAKD